MPNVIKTYLFTEDLPQSSLKPLIDVLYDKIKVDTIVLVHVSENKASYLIKSGTNEARNVISELNTVTDGRGGGKPDFAQGGTQDG